ncbi:MAG: hypothetical protein AAGG06_03895, partial [Pseudomonadota bacterium]
MAAPDDSESMLRAGSPNAAGETVQLVEQGLAMLCCLTAWFGYYCGANEIVRLRTSNAVPPVAAAPYDRPVASARRFIAKKGPLDQASARGTLAQFFLRFEAALTAEDIRDS